MQHKRVIITVLMTAALLVVVLVVCSGCYTLTQGFTMLGYLRRQVPLDSLLTPPGNTTDPDHDADFTKTKRFVERVARIRRFAITTLGLRDSTNYTTYVAIDRDYLAAVVSASAPDSFMPYTWWFPVVGRVPYKGFFDVDDARSQGARLAKKGLDVWIRRVDAFSTLGWFADPLYSYMRDYPEYRLADLLIHELTHATVWLKGQPAFNEALAEFVGREGSRRYMAATFGADSPEYRHMEDAAADSAAFVACIQELIAELEALYTSHPGADILTKKAAIITAFQRRFAAEYPTRFRSDAYRGFATLPVNNAYLALFRLYYEPHPEIDAAYAEAGQDLPRFIALIRSRYGNQ